MTAPHPTLPAIYLDHNATTPCDPRVVDAMLPFFHEVYGNPANGLHPQGRRAARAVEVARAQVAALLHADAAEIIFTAGATESNHLAILGAAYTPHAPERRKIVTTAVEHKAVLLPCERLAAAGFELVILPVDRHGQVDLDAAAAAIDTLTRLVSIQAANNEVGTLQPVAEVAALARRAGALCHCDAAQAVGKVPVDVQAWGVDLLSLSAHKFYGPKGIGALYLRRGVSALTPLSIGGGQERGLRAGTLNVPGIVGMGAATELAAHDLPTEAARQATLRNRLEELILEQHPTAVINAQAAPRLPNTASITLPGVDVDALLLNLPDVMLGTGSACHSGAVEPSHVLTAMGVPHPHAYATLRASLGRSTTAAEIARAAMRITEAAAEQS